MDTLPSLPDTISTWHSFWKSEANELTIAALVAETPMESKFLMDEVVKCDKEAKRLERMMAERN